jgi:hypothetical protein
MMPKTTNTPSAAARSDFRLRFVGRFVFAWTGDAEKPTEIIAVAPNMGFNPDLHSDEHHAFVTVPREFVKARVSSFATMSTFAPDAEPNAGSELFLWDASGNDVLFEGFQRNPITLSDWDSLPDLGVLNGGKVNRALLERPIAGDGPVAARFRLTGGHVRVVQFEEDKRVCFEPLEEMTPQGPHDRYLPDAVEVDLMRGDNTTPLSMTLVSSRDGAKRSIVVARPTADGDPPVVISITNLCTHRGHHGLDDREFAAYYDLMQEPKASRERLIPHAATAPVEGARSDCAGLAKGDGNP